MIYSKTCEYAIRALQYVAEKEKGTYVLTRSVSQSIGVPLAYLAKIFQDLTRHGILSSRRGAAGGFALKREPESISLKEIMEIIDDPKNLKVCVMGFNRCSDLNGCPLHDVWKESRNKILKKLQSCNLSNPVIKKVHARYRPMKRRRLHTGG